MPNIYEVLGVSAGVIGLAGYIPYLYSIFQGKTRPNRASWFIWTLVGGLLAVSYIAEGNSHAIWLPIGYFLGPFIVAFLSLKYGYSEWSRLDTICIIAACISIIPWWLSDNANYTLLINLVIDSTGAIPTILKTYKEPETEDFTAWTIFFIANTLQVLAVRYWDISGAYPIYLFILAATIFGLTLKGKIKNRVSVI
ncbi:MAG: hypothetical protein A3E85_00015 [Gammaproteobacteria bacterium RIFCSPHIGHO2_12_FULL_45_12]|nr:MAG: hypothetical protein A3E85_00015 [Gammaproteobacteria bacterium RIFCSPHIGHO2_12_FULL_45_12]